MNSQPLQYLTVTLEGGFDSCFQLQGEDFILRQFLFETWQGARQTFYNPRGKVSCPSLSVKLDCPFPVFEFTHKWIKKWKFFRLLDEGFLKYLVK